MLGSPCESLVLDVVRDAGVSELCSHGRRWGQRVRRGQYGLMSRRWLLYRHRQRDMERRAPLRPALAPQPPAMRRHERAADRKPHSQAAVLGGVKWLEQRLDVVG